MKDIIFKEESYEIVGACFEVYRQKGCGFTESVYQECLEIEFEMREIPFVSQPIFELDYKGRQLGQFFKPDLVCFDKIIVEIKAIETLNNACRAQTLNYLNATGFDLAILINFGHYPKLEYERVVNDRNKRSLVSYLLEPDHNTGL